MDADAVAKLDARGFTVLESIGHNRPPPAGSHATHATPHGFVCVDGNTHWIKRKAQQGLVAELVAGRLDAIVGATSPAVIANVVPEAMPADNPPNHLLGLGVGSRDEPKMENTQNLGQHFPARHGSWRVPGFPATFRAHAEPYPRLSRTRLVPDMPPKRLIRWHRTLRLAGKGPESSEDELDRILGN